MYDEYIVKVYKDRTEWCNKKRQLHKKDGPAVEWNNGSKEWWLNDMRHREDGPAVEYDNGTKHWYLYGQLHREDGPAVECNDGYKAWYINGVYHREDGPAVEFISGYKEWWFWGMKLTRMEFYMKILMSGKSVVIDNKEYKLVEV